MGRGLGAAGGGVMGNLARGASAAGSAVANKRLKPQPSPDIQPPLGGPPQASTPWPGTRNNPNVPGGGYGGPGINQFPEGGFENPGHTPGTPPNWGGREMQPRKPRFLGDGMFPQRNLF